MHPEPVKRMMSSAAFPVTRAFTDSEEGREGGREGGRVSEGGRVGGWKEGKSKHTGDDLAGLVAIERGLHAGDGGSGVGVAVEGHHLQAQEVLGGGGERRKEGRKEGKHTGV